MRTISAIAASLFAMPASAQEAAPSATENLRAAAPAMATYTSDLLFADVWERTELAPRDRSLVTVAALIAGGHTAQMPSHFGRALDNGVQPSEISAIITHLAFYTGWPNSVSAAGVARSVFETRGIPAAEIVGASRPTLPIDAAAETKRAAIVAEQVAPLAPALARYTDEVLFNDLWRRPDLSSRDRSLVTIAALAANGEAGQLGFHLDRGFDNRVSSVEASEVFTHLAFYAGWPKAMSAVAVLREVLDGRSAKATAGKIRKTDLRITRRGAMPPQAGPAATFTGTVRVEGRFAGDAPARVGGATVMFEPCARTAWHTHPLGQTLIITAGTGRVQRAGGSVEEIRTGDIVWIPPGVRHWHGASPNTSVTHVAIAESLNGSAVTWFEHVTDAEYRAPFTETD